MPLLHYCLSVICSKGCKLELQNSITRENLKTLVSLFYERALNDKDIGNIFLVEFGDDITNEEWTEHIELLVNFWDSVFLDETAYNGDPFGPHFTIVNLKNDHFKPWVDLFTATANEIYVPKVAALFKEKGELYSKEFIHRLSQETKNSVLRFM